MNPFKFLKWIIHPISILVMAQIVWGLLMFIWIRWYVLRSHEIALLVQKIALPRSTTGQWVILTQGCILMGFLLLALYSIFVSQRRQYRLTKMQDAILSSVTHELKTPLASIRLYTETLLTHKLAPDVLYTFLTRTLNETERLQKLVDTVLVSARLETRVFQDQETERVDLSFLVDKCVQKLKERAQCSRIIETDIQPDLCIHGHPTQLTILIDNLLDNAFKYTHAQGTILIRLQEGLKKGTVQCMVSDNGIGIHKLDLKKIFLKFYRTERNSFHSVKGSGLGLWVCKSIVRAHDGSFEVASTPQQGSQFYVTFKRLDPLD